MRQRKTDLQTQLNKLTHLNQLDTALHLQVGGKGGSREGEGGKQGGRGGKQGGR